MDRTTFLPMDDKHLGQFGENTARAFRPEGWMGGRPVWRLTLDRATGTELGRELVLDNHSKVLYDHALIPQEEIAAV